VIMEHLETRRCSTTLVKCHFDERRTAAADGAAIATLRSGEIMRRR